jgi:TatD DNase family protein
VIDIGVNLTNKRFAKDLDGVLARAAEAGVDRVVITGTSVGASRAAAAMADDKAQYATAGVHPHDAKSCDGATIDTLTELASRARVVAIGECGLDFDRDFSPRPVQERWFEAQLELAAKLQLPVFLHERAAHERFVAILRQHRDALKGAVIHCYTGTRDELKAYLDLDLHVGITGWICDERRGTHLLEDVKLIGDDRLMIETDAPYLFPRTMRPRPKGGRNEPAFLTYVRDTVAEARGVTPEHVADVTTKTAAAFFSL